METIVSILCDNSIKAPGFMGEHGFSALIERNGEKLLFDAGSALSIEHNLKKLDRNLEGLTKILVSHGHYDHTGGLKWVLEQVGRVEVVAHPAMFSKHMARNPEDPNDTGRYIGCPYPREELEQLGAVFRFTDRSIEVVSGVWFLVGIEREQDHVPSDPRLVLPGGGSLQLDPIEDDASLLIETDEDPVLVLGCAHGGVLNILDHAKNEMGVNKLKAILGGTHLLLVGSKDMPEIIEKFEEFSVKLLGVSHCTGMKATLELARHFGDRFELASAGSVFRF
ncbi:MAG: MBL fold metallo-hydrolase [Deltaproteobacteria bacterium]|nr:MBL fold metallo-hydrolase [Deltaproteobacteria bacterium]